jgi:flagellar basal body-associated protein FliL
MGSILSRLLTVVVGIAGSAVAGYFLWVSHKMLAEFPVDAPAAHAEVAAEGGHGAPAGGHGAPAADAHGAPAADAHGAPAADAHGAPAADAHGAAARTPASAEKHASVSRAWVSMDQMFVNLSGPENEGHSLTFQVEIELFDENNRQIIESRLATLKNAAIEVARDQSYGRLTSLSGKLYFKESLVSAMNESLRQPIIRDIHMGTIFLK